MKKTFLLFTILFFGVEIYAQNPGDTIVVQTFDYSMTYGSGPWSGGDRDTIAHFPNDPNLTFEKIIMSYNMRCKDAQVNTSGGNGVACGEWDYSCNTYIHDSTRIDSLHSSHPSHTISNFTGTTYNYSVSPVYNYTQYLQNNAVVSSVVSEDTTVVGSGLDSLDFVLKTENNTHKSQFLYRASELNSLGLIQDSINALSLNILSGNSYAHFLSIKLKLTSDAVLDPSSPHLVGFTEVYNSNVVLYNGLNKFHFSTPFLWDSVSNIIVEFSFTNSTASSFTDVEGEQTNEILSLYSSDANHITVNSSESIDIPVSAMGNISDEVTVSFWINGDENVMPQNTTIVEAYDPTGKRTLNIHFPWSNGRMYWDCGNSGTTNYDRIDKAANLNEYTGEWSHWAFTKNTNTGSLKIYRNGQLWHSGTGHTRTLDIASMKLASQGNASGYFWDGNIKEFRVFDKELSQNTIQQWMNLRINNTHPDYVNLVAHYPLNEGVGTTSSDQTANQQTATFSGNVLWNFDRGHDINQFFTSSTYRPNINLYQGQYTITMVTDTILDSIISTPNTVKEYAIVPNWGVLQHDSIATISTNSYWEAISYLYDANGNIISTTPINIDGTITITDLSYFKRYPMAFQIMSFVTPYGIGLDLGQNGKTWYFDMTDYAPIFKGPKRITMNAGGQWQEDMDIQFLFIVGTPPRDVIETQNIWRVESKSYVSIQNDDAFEQRSHTLNPNAVDFKIKTAITGHGQQGEFIPQFHKMSLDGSVMDTWKVWKECSDNPVYPQGGTWIYDRAGWCPGMATDIQELKITPFVTPGQSHTFDYGINGGSGTSNYWVSSHLVSYGPANFTLDARVSDILSPTNRVDYERTNPICSKPQVVIQNSGSTTLTSLRIEYWINNNSQKEIYTWNGTLEFLETDTVSLPDPSSLWLNMDSLHNTFYVNVSEPNGGFDEYSYNNLSKSSFAPAPVLPSVFSIWIQTNSGVISSWTNESETSWEIFDNDDLLEFASPTYYANTPYRDTVDFSPGCYTLLVSDTGDDGLDFWANSDGVGYIRLRKIGGNWLNVFEPDFGRFIQYEFRVEEVLGLHSEDIFNFQVFPNPATDEIIISSDFTKLKNLSILDNTGRVVTEINLSPVKSVLHVDISNLAEGVYFISSSNKNLIKKFIKQ